MRPADDAPPSESELIDFAIDRMEHGRYVACMAAFMKCRERFPYIGQQLNEAALREQKQRYAARYETVHQIVHQKTSDPRGRKPIGDKPLTDTEKKRRYRARKKAKASQFEPPSSSGSVDLFDLYPSEEANAVAGKVFDFLERFSSQLEPWFERELSRDDREIIRHALNMSVNTLGQWALDLWKE